MSNNQLTIPEQIENYLSSKAIGEIITTGTLKRELSRFFGNPENSYIPSDYCYNSYCKASQWDTNKIFFFEKLDKKGEFKYLGKHYPYTGKVFDKNNNIYGYWNEGKFSIKPTENNLKSGENNMNTNIYTCSTTEDKIVYTDRKDLPLSTILEMYNDGDIITQPDYQRDYIMDDKKASKLIESVLLQIPIPTIYLCEESDSRSSVIDGQQRITSFVRYLSNEFKLTGLEELSTLNGKYFKDLDKNYQRKIKQTTISSIVIKKESQDLKYEIFARLNQGSVKLKPQELRNCIYRGSLNNLIESIAKENHTLPLLFHSENNRKQYQEYILRFFALKNFNECSSSLKKTMNDYMAKNQNIDKTEIDKLKTLFNSKIDIIKQIFGETAFCSYDRQNDKITKSFSGSIYDSLIIPCSFFDNHSLMVHANELREQFEATKRNNLQYQDYTYAATGSKSRVIGRIMLIYNLISNIVKNENTKRIFDSDTKEYLWANSEHICAYCKQAILDINDAEVDHIFAYSKGGETTIENAQLLHRHCNRVKNNSVDIDSVNFEDDAE